MRKTEGSVRAILIVALIAAVAALVAGCGAKHSVGDKVVYDPDSEEAQKAEGADNGQEATDPGQAGEEAEATAGSDQQAGDGPTEATKPEPQAGQFLEAKGTSVGDEDWVAEIRGEGEGLWLASPFDADRTYVMVRAATYLQGLRMAEEDFGGRRFTTTRAYHAWHSDNEGGWALTMKVLTKGFGKDARYRFRVSVDPRDGGSRIDVAQYREVMEEQPQQDVGDWVEADEPDPEITRKYLEGIRRALGE